ncbi:uncharacterized protein [Antedon mediterranea]|uniref:uncharacterized protein n=1 Tax=Antedon mediterranea TaxID=105859 RepID=UPI003AF4D7A9
MKHSSGKRRKVAPSGPAAPADVSVASQQGKLIHDSKHKSTKSKQKPVSETPTVDNRLDKMEHFMRESRQENSELREMLETVLLERTRPTRPSDEYDDDQGQYIESEYKTHQQNDVESGYINNDISDSEVVDLESLGQCQEKDKQTKKLGFAKRFATLIEEGKPLQEVQADSVNYMITTPLEEKYMTENCQKYPKPINCQNLLVPRVNPLIWENLTPNVQNLDLKIQKCQKPLVKGLVAFLRSADELPTLTKTQEDSVALLASAHFELNQLRKELIKPDLNARYTHLCKTRVKTTEWLFGNNLHKAVKELEEEQKTVGVMKNRQGQYRSHRFTPYQNSGSIANRRSYQNRSINTAFQQAVVDHTCLF